MPETLQHIKLTDIRVSKNHNPRRTFDDSALKKLSESIKANGVTSPILVGPPENGKYPLIAGERRLRASKLAKRVDIPAMVRDDDDGRARTLALVENLVREDLDPIEEAQGYQDLLDENGWNQKQLAAEVGVSTAQVSQRLSLLRLPEAAQKLMANGSVSLEHTKTLRDVAEISPDFSTHLARIIAGEPRIEWNHVHAAEANFKGIAVNLFGNIHSSDLERIGDADVNKKFVKAFPETWNYPRWDQDDVDAARSYGCLVTIPYSGHRGEKSTAFIAVDRDFLVGRLEQKLERAKQSAGDKAKAAGKSAPAGEKSQAQAEQLKAEAAAEREAAEKARAKARAFNFEIGEKLALALHEPDLTLEHMQLLASVILSAHDNRHLGVASFALTDPKISEVNDRGTMKILTLGEAADDLKQRIDAAKTPQQILGVLLQAFISSQIADPSCLPQSAQPHYSFPGSYSDPPVAERLALSEALKVFKPGTNTYKRIKKQLGELKD